MAEKKRPVLYIVVPCFNEEKVLPITSNLFLEELNSLIHKRKIDQDSRILFVNDGSKDATWEIIKNLSAQNRHCSGISQSRNRGHQSAVLAGLLESKDKCDITISIDCDGQDDIAAMEQMVDAYLDGSEVVYGVRSKRDTDSFFKRFTAESFYKILNLMGAEVVFNHADYRLVSSRVLQEFSNFQEVNLFLRGMFPLVGFKSSCVYYERHERIAGKNRSASMETKTKDTGLVVPKLYKLRHVIPFRLITVLAKTQRMFYDSDHAYGYVIIAKKI